MLFFPAVYKAFDLMAEKVGKTSATALIHSLLSNDNPAVNFLTIILDMCKIDRSVSTKPTLWKLSPISTKYLANLSFEKACDFFTNAIDKLDMNEEKTRLLRVAAATQEWNADEDIDGFVKFLFGLPSTILFNKYSDFIHPFANKSELEIAEDVEYGEFFIVLEAIRQQLTQGNGLLCPFWL
jgi:hypothetical protein